MKNLIKTKLWVALVLSVLMVTAYSCKEESKTADTNFNDVMQDQTSTTPAATSPMTTGSTGTVYHYICAAGHPGSASEGNCTTCGEPLTHNAAFHNQPNAATTPTAPTNNSPVVNPVASPMQNNPGAATNAAGVYHYICTAGCAGGAAAAGNCATCGQALTHNADFHK